MSEEQQNNNEEEYSRDQIERLWNWGLHEDNSFFARSNFFLLSVSMLFVAMTVFFSGERDNIVLVYIIGIAGVAISFMWLFQSWIHIHLTINKIKEIVRENLPEYGDIAKARTKFPSTLKIMGIYLPTLILLIWLAVLYILVFNIPMNC